MCIKCILTNDQQVKSIIFYSVSVLYVYIIKTVNNSDWIENYTYDIFNFVIQMYGFIKK